MNVYDYQYRKACSIPTRGDIIAKYTTAATFLGGFILSLAYVITSFSDESNIINTYSSENTDEEKLKRQKMRGTIASIVTTLIFSGMNYGIDKGGDVDASTSTALVGLGFGGTLGFLMDNAIGSDVGFGKIKEKGIMESWKYALSTLPTSAYSRYLITVLFDLFISMIIFKPAYNFLKEAPFFRCGNEGIANVIVSGVVGITTFQCYANITRFAWAYPGKDVKDRSTLIKGSTIQLAMGISSALFLATNTQLGRYNDPGLNNPSVKLAIVVGSMVYIAALNKYNVLEPSLENEKDEKDEKDEEDEQYYSSVLGSLMLTAIGVLFGGFTLFKTGKVDMKRKLVVFVIWCLMVSMFSIPGLVPSA